ncbi:ribonuclease P protein component [Corynebacterium neomassiliense]|uniref:ribonuclease P protein component n=1 Tax=Corynebacterium neomassiliense TaxID=2079482 RepID=UPI001031CC71|nr:ribonuclease P protein component [Corynebacterium neomassiliense]
MLPPEHRLRSTSLFGETVRRGRKKGSRTAVVYVYERQYEGTGAGYPATVGGPRVGLVVSKAVGNAVTRHAVSRKLRHTAGRIIADGVPAGLLRPEHSVVLRALPAAADATSGELERDVRHALQRLLS